MIQLGDCQDIFPSKALCLLASLTLCLLLSLTPSCSQSLLIPRLLAPAIHFSVLPVEIK